MTTPKNFLAICIAAGLAAFLPCTARAQSTVILPDGPKVATPVKSVYHLMHRTPLFNTGVISNASGGHVQAVQNNPGLADKESLLIRATNLAPATTYQLVALRGDDVSFVQVGAFTTDAKGKAVLKYKWTDDGLGNVNTKPLGIGNALLPDLLRPLNNVRELHIQDGDGLSVLTAEFSAPNIFQYGVTRALSNDGFDLDAAGLMRVIGNRNKARVVVKATAGLVPNAPYSVALNGGVSATSLADRYGKLVVSVQLGNPVGILALQTVSISDSNNVSILSGTLP